MGSSSLRGTFTSATIVGLACLTGCTIDLAPPESSEDEVGSSLQAVNAAASAAPVTPAPATPTAAGNNAGGAQGNAPAAKADAVIDVRRSLVVTEQPILQRFGFRRVMEQLASQANIPGLTAVQLFQQWWDTNNPAPGLGLGPNCNSEVDPVYGSSINGFPFDCRPAPAEGAQSTCTSLDDPSCAYIPIGLFNRFDLAPVDGSHCGEHRIVYAKATGPSDLTDRNLIIFEAIMPNPQPQQGLKGCKKIVDTWADLSAIADISERANRLEAFYFQGAPNQQPVVHIEHYGDNAFGAGQIRTNQFMQPLTRPEGSLFVWSLREFKLDKTCAPTGCAMKMLPVTVKNNPFGPLLSSTNTDPRALDFQAAFVRDNISSLSASSVGNIAMNTPNGFNAPQAHTSFSDEMNYTLHFGSAPSAFRTAIQDKLTSLGSALTPDNVVQRALTQTCAGCHQLSNTVGLGGGLVWPASLGFVHVSEVDPEVVGGVTRFRISPALTDALLPVRKQVLEDYLQNKPPKTRGKGRTLGGSETH